MPPSTKPALTRGHEPPRSRDLGKHARRTGRNVLLMAAAVKLLDAGATSLAHDTWAGLAEIVVGLSCLIAYELTD